VIQFLMDNALAVGGVAFFWVLFTLGSMTERVMLFLVVGSLFVLLQTGSAQATIGILAVGGTLLLFDRLRRR
jgi:hypothetical protein